MAGPIVQRRISLHLDLQQWRAVRIGHVHGAGKAGVKTVDGAQDLQRLLGIRQLGAAQGSLVRAVLPQRVTRAGIPRAGHDRLVVVDQSILDHDPMR